MSADSLVQRAKSSFVRGAEISMILFSRALRAREKDYYTAGIEFACCRHVAKITHGGAVGALAFNFFLRTPFFYFAPQGIFFAKMRF